MQIKSELARFPLIAIFRGVTPDEVVPIAEAVVEAGFQVLEVPLNSPKPLASIALLARRFPDLLVGAGTVLSSASVRDVSSVGGRIVLMPHSDPEVIKEAKRAGLLCVPGVATPTEAFAALANGADALKLYPAELLAPSVVKALKVVLPSGSCLLPVGGITPDNMEAYARAGADGFGLGSALYRAGISVVEVRAKAIQFKKAVLQLRDQGLL